MSKHTPGPWVWSVKPGGEIRLATPDRGHLYVMCFARLGMQRAQPRFAIWGDGPRERKGGYLEDGSKLDLASHPDACLIAAAPDLLAALETALSVIKDYLEYEHNGDPWVEDARAMGEMDIDDYQRDGKLEAALAVVAKAKGEQNG